MCLIVHSPTGELLPREAFDYARWTNSDGIGIMSAQGVAKFVGRKSGKRAWRYLRRLADDGAAYGLHFRWATHGAVNRDNCHPFLAPGSDAAVMHNGVLRQTAALASAAHSDTALFVQKYMVNAPDTASEKYQKFYGKLEKAIGWENKFLVFHANTGEFTICNEGEGSWIDGLWYSNEYSLPDTMLPAKVPGKAAAWLDYGRTDTLAAYAYDTGPRAYGSPDYGYPLPALASEYAADEYADRRVRDGIGCGMARSWRDERDLALADMAIQAAKRGNARVTGNVTNSEYYRLLELQEPSGYYEDGCELGTAAAAKVNARLSCASDCAQPCGECRAPCNGDRGLPINAGEIDNDRDYLEFLKRSGLNPRA